MSPSVDKLIGAFKLSATNDGVRLYDVTVTGTGLDNLNNIRLTSNTGFVIANATTSTSTGVTFTSINNAPVVAKDTTVSYYIVANVNSNTSAGPIALTVTTGGTNIKGSNGNTIAVAGVNVTTNNHAIAENTAVLAMTSNLSKSLTTSALRFSVTAAGKTNIQLTGLTMTNSLAGYTGTMLVTVYKTSIAAGNMAAQKALANGSSSTLTMTGNSSLNSVIDAGSTVEYIVVVE